MYKACAAIVLVLMAMAVAQGAGVPAPLIPGSLAVTGANLADGQSGGAAAGQKVIRDPAEYHAYMAALNAPDPAGKTAAMEVFLQQFPNTIMKVEALEQIMAGYQHVGNQAKIAETVQKILEISPENVRALAIAAFLKRYDKSPQAANEVRALAAKGLAALPAWPKPAGMGDVEFEGLRRQMAVIFNGACGYGAYQAKDFAAARNCYLQAVQADPAQAENVYQLALADLEMSPLDPYGFWYLARAVNLNKTTIPTLNDYGKSKYRRYHGNDEGWDQLVARAATQSDPPADFKVTPAPTPAEIAVQAVKANDPAALSFSDWEYILSYRDASPANREAADVVWAVIQTKQQRGAARLRLPVKVIAVNVSSISAAITDENQQADPPQADLQVMFDKPLTRVPAVGSNIDVIGVITDYTPKPFQFIMTKGELPAVKPPSRKP